MFTGIVEEIGEVTAMVLVKELTRWDGTKGEGYELTVKVKVALEGCYLGASIAVNGVCLTAIRFDNETVTFGVAPETLRLTNLVDLKKGDNVNIERAAAANSRNSGHYVQGHVDTTGDILEKRFEGESLWIKIKAPKILMNYIVPKGFIAIDGTSLTVCEVSIDECWFTFMLIQFTQQHIIVPKKPVGGRVNLEVDVMGKYAEKSIENVLIKVDEASRKLADVISRIEAIEKRSSGSAEEASSSSSAKKKQKV